MDIGYCERLWLQYKEEQSHPFVSFVVPLLTGKCGNRTDWTVTAQASIRCHCCLAVKRLGSRMLWKLGIKVECNVQMFRIKSTLLNAFKSHREISACTSRLTIELISLEKLLTLFTNLAALFLWIDLMQKGELRKCDCPPLLENCLEQHGLAINVMRPFHRRSSFYLSLAFT